MPGLRINRNILECKECTGLFVGCVLPVLIETYWNVKAEMLGTLHWYIFVLIETYWNVKEERSIRKSDLARY